MIYVVTHQKADYVLAHADVGLGLHFARGLRACGEDVTVLWGGGVAMVGGVAHENINSAKPKPDDILFVVFLPTAAQIVRDSRFSALMVPREKWLFMFAGAPGHEDVLARFDPIFLESPTDINKVKRAAPGKRVTWLMAGVPDEADLSIASPYPARGRHLFLAGRLILDQNRPEFFVGFQMRMLLDALGDDYHLWYASNTIGVPTCSYSSPLIGPETVGKTLYTAIDGIPAPWLADGGGIWVEPSVFRVLADAVVNHPRAHCLGPLNYGTYWNWHHHAWASIDHGLEQNASAINCKILDPLRAGGRIVADGTSVSYYLIRKHGAGVVVPWRDVEAKAAAVMSLPAETSRERTERAIRVRAAESWHARSAALLRFVSGGEEWSDPCAA